MAVTQGALWGIKSLYQKGDLAGIPPKIYCWAHPREAGRVQEVDAEG